MKWMMTTTAVLKEDKLYQIDLQDEMDDDYHCCFERGQAIPNQAT